jgi:3'(2'), 5'-bisphosphate nucleotidase
VQVAELAEAAGNRILEVYETDFAVDFKEDQSPLTAADLAAHETIVDGLEALRPALPILSEESAEVGFAERASWPAYWLVDPLDGTKEFVKRNGEFTVNIALILGHEPVLGVVNAPVLGLSYDAAASIGAFRRQRGRDATPIRTQRLSGGPLRVVGSRSHAGAQLQGFLERVGQYQLVSMGSSLKFCLVAEGSADIYPRFGPTSEWDTAAAQCVVEQAGGRVTDTRMRPLRYNAKESLLNPYFIVSADPERDWSEFIEG